MLGDTSHTQTMAGQTIAGQTMVADVDIGNATTIWLLRKIWLPRLVYVCLPYFYIAAGIAAVVGTLYISEWFWVLPHYFLFAAACLHLGFAIGNKRLRSRKR